MAASCKDHPPACSWLDLDDLVLMTVETVPAELADTVERLQNWARWAEERGARGRAASAEGRYRPRWGNNETEADADDRARRKALPPIDPWDAQTVGKAIAPAGGFPLRMFQLIRWKYLLRAPPLVICRKLAINSSSYAQELNHALYAASNRLLTKRQASLQSIRY